MKTVFTNAAILIGAGNWRPIENGYIAVDGDRIAEIGLGPYCGAADLIRDMSGKLILPGLYNMHSHTPMSILRGAGTGLALQQWLFERMFPLEAKMNADDMRIGCRLAIAEMLSGGVVSFSDMYHYPADYVQEIIDAGIKANVSFPIMEENPTGSQAHDSRFNLSVEFVRAFDESAGGRLKADFGIHAEYTNTPESMERYARVCQEMNGRMHLHLSETAAEHDRCKQRYGKTPARLFADLGVFENPTIAAHCVFAEPEDIELFREKGVSPIHNPSSNMKLGSGLMPIRAMLDAGVRLTIGTDSSASNNNQNLFEEIHLAAMIHCGFHRDATVIRAEELLDMATINGAIAQGRPDCGALKAGYKADLIAVDLRRPHLIPNHDTAALLVYSAQASDVVLTMVDGRIVYEDGRLLTIDCEKMAADADASLRRVFSVDVAPAG